MGTNLLPCSTAATSPEISPTMPAKRKNNVRIRCYRQGFGDCFLLSFDTGKARACQVLIDCGLWPSGPEHKETMRKIAADIVAETGGDVSLKKKGIVDVLVVTHEHWDHLSGFNQARDIFKEFLTVRHLWLAWTEKKGDQLADQLREEYEKKKKAARRLHARLQGLKSAPGFSTSNQTALDQLGSLLGFFGAAGDGGVGGGADPAGAMKFVREDWGDPHRHFHRPGALLELPDVEGVRTYVLGPPRDAKLLRRESSERHGALYELFFGLSPEDSLLAALGAIDGDVGRIRDVEEIGQPFDRSHRHAVDLDGKKTAAALATDLAAFFDEHYGGANDHWRRIDADWLNTGGALALRLDKGINNTSLVLAFELPDGRVLLFPGDAQLGNWESWHQLSWENRAPEGKRITARDLLDRTVFYKVGHHGSHNATANELGLELMNDPDLMAFIPISHQMALDNDWKRIPLPGLVRRLREKTKKRVWFGIEYDKDGKDFTNPDIDALNDLTKTERAALKKAVTPKPLWIDFTL